MLALALLALSSVEGLLAQPDVDRPLRGEGRLRLFELPPAPPRDLILRERHRVSRDPGLEDALERALTRLAGIQRPDGLWSDDLNATSLALIAFASAGYETSVEPHARTVRQGVRALLERRAEWGFDIRRLALATAALASIVSRRPHWTSLTVPLEGARAELLDRRGADGTWGGSAVTLWARLAFHTPNAFPRPALESDAPEHEGFMACYGGDRRAWAAWLAEARPRLLKDVEGAEATARQAIEIATPYRFMGYPPYPLRWSGGREASTSGPSSAGRPR